MNNQLHYITELLDAFRTLGEEAVGNHLSEDECVRYAMDNLNQLEQEAIDAHIAVCSDCASRIERLFVESQAWTRDSSQQRLDVFSKSLLDKVASTSDRVPHPQALPRELGEHSIDRATLRLRTQTELSILSLFEDLGVIEREYDYVLPSGFHCDTYINTSKLCRSENGLNEVSRAFDALFDDIVFDTVVCSGWATGMIARRLARKRSMRCGRQVRVVVAEGYSNPFFTEDIVPESQVLILIDVIITGHLSVRLTNRVRQFGALVVAVGCIVRPTSTSLASEPEQRALVVVEMNFNDPEHGRCPRCASLRKLVFNPISSQMTVKKLTPRSPTQFLEDFPAAVNFWEAVNTAKAYEHHHVEEHNHYIAFVNTAKMIAHPTVGPKILHSLVELIINAEEQPDVILMPDRARARLLAGNVLELLAERSVSHSTEVLRSQRHDGFWKVTEHARKRMSHKNVLVLDCAAGHGCVLDELTLLASESNARSVSAAVLLSRLTLSCEEAFQHRLDGRFYRLFHLPIRPIGIRTEDSSLCPVCNERALIQRAAEDKQYEALVQLARQAVNRRRRRRTPMTDHSDKVMPAQLLLFDVPNVPLLQRCVRAIASGITLHALHTAMTDGMAPLALPELCNSAIPPENRAAMLENLPPGVLAWSDNFLDQSIEDVLAQGNDRSVWLASTDILAREGRTYWIAYLESFLERSNELKRNPHDTFWNRLAYGAYRVSFNDADVREEINEITQNLLKNYRDTVSANGLRRVVDVVAHSGTREHEVSNEG